MRRQESSAVRRFRGTPSPFGRTCIVTNRCELARSHSLRYLIAARPCSLGSRSVRAAHRTRIRAGSSLVIGVLTKISARPPGAEQRRVATGQVDLLGEIKSNAAGAPYFQRGVTEYPAIGDEVELIGSRELPLIFDVAGPNTIDVGHLQQDPSIGAYVNVDDLVSKHFAVFGTTG